MIRYLAVSYTHLDVYKRQSQFLTIFVSYSNQYIIFMIITTIIIPECSRSQFCSTVNPVSYTHLDELPKFAKLGMVEVLLATSVLLAVFTRWSTLVKQVLLTGATFLTGTLFAVFGQIYQTGADVYKRQVFGIGFPITVGHPDKKRNMKLIIGRYRCCLLYTSRCV